MRRVVLALLLVAAPAAAQQGVYVRQGGPAWLGVSYELRWVQVENQCTPQVVVDAVVQGSPAERAGLRAGDAILALNSAPLSVGRLQEVAETLAPGDSIHLLIRRSGRSREVTAVADRRPDRPVSLIVERSSGLRSSTAPIIEVSGDSLIARNLSAEWSPARTRSYWLQREDRVEYHSLGGWSRSELDRRVANLLLCADSAGARATWSEARTPVRVDLRRVQARADSIRVAITRRALLRADSLRADSVLVIRGPGGMVSREPGGVLQRVVPGAPGSPTTVQLLGPEGSYTFRVEDHMAAGLRGVAGAELTAMEPELADYFRNVDRGLLVLRIAPDTPADRAGLRPGDVVVGANGRRVESVDELRQIIALPSGAVALRVIRRGRTVELTLPRS